MGLVAYSLTDTYQPSRSTTSAIAHRRDRADLVVVRIGDGRRPSLAARTVEAEVDDDVEHLPFGTRMAIILGGGLLGWAVPIAFAWSFFR